MYDAHITTLSDLRDTYMHQRYRKRKKANSDTPGRDAIRNDVDF